jgi:hypothetical protein
VRAMEADTIERPSWLDTKFIEDALHSREEYGDVIVVDIRVQLAVGKGENYTSLVYRVGVEFKRRNIIDETESTSLIIKGLSAVEVMAKFLAEHNIFEKETKIYQVTIPAMMHLLQQNFQGRKFQHLAPFCYRTSRPHTLILEDLTSMGFKMADRRSRLDLLHCTLAIKGLARFHAMSVALHDKNPTSMDAYVEDMYTDKNRDMMSNFIRPSLEAIANAVEKWPGFVEYADKFRKIIPTTWDRLLEAVRPVSGSLSVLNHGDFWVNNMMFHYCPHTGKADDVRFIDFQISRYTSPAVDLLYFMYTSPSEEVRSEYTEFLLETYHRELRYILKVLGCEHHEFTIEQLKKEFEEKSFFGLITVCTILTAVLAEPTETFDMENLKDDGTSLDPANYERIYSGRRYKQAAQILLPHFQSKGLL